MIKKSSNKPSATVKARESELQTDDVNELNAMAEFYAKNSREVYFVRDLIAGVVIAVMTFPADPGKMKLKWRGRRYNIFPYNDRLFAVRERLDTLPDGSKMIGFESAIIVDGERNDTRLGAAERGAVATSMQPIATSQGSFEQFMAEQKVVENQATDPGKVDYEKTERDGRTIERYETFEIERVK